MEGKERKETKKRRKKKERGKNEGNGFGEMELQSNETMRSGDEVMRSVSSTLAGKRAGKGKGGDD